MKRICENADDLGKVMYDSLNEQANQSSDFKEYETKVLDFLSKFECDVHKEKIKSLKCHFDLKNGIEFEIHACCAEFVNELQQKRKENCKIEYK